MVKHYPKKKKLTDECAYHMHLDFKAYVQFLIVESGELDLNFFDLSKEEQIKLLNLYCDTPVENHGINAIKNKISEIQIFINLENQSLSNFAFFRINKIQDLIFREKNAEFLKSMKTEEEKINE
jgi:hypothetical protein